MNLLKEQEPATFHSQADVGFRSGIFASALEEGYDAEQGNSDDGNEVDSAADD